MISATDSFIAYLSGELSGTLSVHWLRKSATDATAHLFQSNALNVSIFQAAENGSSEEILVSLDILADDERTAWGWAKAVRDKLIERQYTPELDYEADPDSPVATGRYVSWDRDDITFEMVPVHENQIQLNATFNICHVRM
jgi:hypothetical protein